MVNLRDVWTQHGGVCRLFPFPDLAAGAVMLGSAVSHVQIKDLRRTKDGWEHVLTGDGNFPLREQLRSLEEMQYDRFVSFEWGKKWHPEIPDAEIALPHFIQWFRRNMTE